MKYKVYHLQDSTYQVVYLETNNVEYQGNLADCEAYIRLTEKGYM